MNSDDIMDKVEQRAEEALDELGKMKLTDPEYAKVLSNATALIQMKADQEKRDQEKYDSNYKYELDEERLKLEEKKIKASRLNSWINGATAALASVTTVGLGLLSYAGNKDGMADRSIWGLVNGAANKVSSWLSKSK